MVGNRIVEEEGNEWTDVYIYSDTLKLLISIQIVKNGPSYPLRNPMLFPQWSYDDIV